MLSKSHQLYHKFGIPNLKHLHYGLTKKPIKYKSISSMDDLERIKDKIEHVKKVVGTKH